MLDLGSGAKVLLLCCEDWSPAAQLPIELGLFLSLQQQDPILIEFLYMWRQLGCTSALGDPPVLRWVFYPLHRVPFSRGTEAKGHLGIEDHFSASWVQHLQWDLTSPSVNQCSADHHTILHPEPWEQLH